MWFWLKAEGVARHEVLDLAASETRSRVYSTLSAAGSLRTARRVASDVRTGRDVGRRAGVWEHRSAGRRVAARRSIASSRMVDIAGENR